MDSLRLVICVRPDCQQLFFLGRVCDRGPRYCSRACAGHARRVTLQGAGQRYQQSRHGRFHHAARQARYRARRANVTHQTSQAPTASGIVAFAPPPSVRILTDEPTAEEATDANPVDGSGSVGLLRQIGRSPFGMALRAIRDNDTIAEFIGIPVRRYRWQAFVLSSVFTGLAGGLYGQLSRQITPEQLHWFFSAHLVLATVLGATRQFLGPVAGAIGFAVLEDISLRLTEYRGLVLGLLLVAVVFVFPGGIAGTATRLASGWSRPARA